MSELPESSKDLFLPSSWNKDYLGDVKTFECDLPNTNKRLKIQNLISVLLEELGYLGNDRTSAAQIIVKINIDPVLRALIRQESAKPLPSDEDTLKNASNTLLAICYLLMANYWDGQI